MPLFRILFGLIAIGILVGIHYYLYRRLILDVTDRKAVRWGVLVGGISVFVTSFFGFSHARTHGPSPLALVLPVWTGMITYVALVMIVIDGVRKLRTKRADPVSPERRLFLARAAATTSVIAGGGLASFGAYRAFAPPRITEVPLRLARLPKALEGFTLVQLSDVHIGPVLKRAFLMELVQRSNALKPDLITITGDLVDGKPRYLGSAVEALTSLKSKYGTYFVTGNHDYYSGADEWVSVLQGWGIHTLRNRRVEIGDAGGSIDLLGVDDWGAPGLSLKQRHYDLEAAAAGRSPDRASILLAHQPSNFDVVAKAGIDLQLSGHTHGGQTFPATGIASMMWGERNAGLSKTQDSYLFVSRGCGFVGPPARLGSPPEIVKIVLTSAA